MEHTGRHAEVPGNLSRRQPANGVTVIYYAIMHEASGELMPVMKNGRGYTYWNPGSNLWDASCSTGTPRLFSTHKHAAGAVAKWAGYKLKVLRSLDGDQWGTHWVLSPDHIPRSSKELKIITVDLSCISA